MFFIIITIIKDGKILENLFCEKVTNNDNEM